VKQRRAQLAIAALIIAAGAVDCSRSDSPATPAEELLHIEHLARLDNPWGMTFLPDGSLLITEKPGRLRLYAGGKLSEPIGGVPVVVFGRQAGLLDVEIDPAFAANRLVYLSYAEPQSQALPEKVVESEVIAGTAVGRGRLEGSELRDFTVIWRQIPKMTGLGHFGGRMVFAPDGKLFVTSGERIRATPAQMLDTNLGKIVRLNPDGSVPADNPTLTKLEGMPEIWTTGHRNPLGAALNPWSKELWINEMGPKGGDELNVIDAGRNYGWPLVCDGSNYDDSPIPDHSTQPGLAAPVRSWNPSISPSGFAFYTGEMFPAWRGNVLIGGLSSNALIRLTIDGRKVTGEERIGMERRVRDVIQAPDGAVLVLTDGPQGELLRLTPKDA
jgi:glucose/arabinose dehydrogenase